MINHFHKAESPRVDFELRKSLRRDLAQLISGRSGPEEFRDEACFRYSLTNDTTIREIANRCAEICGNTSTRQTQPRMGISNADAQRMVARSILFLQSNNSLARSWQGIGLHCRLVVGLLVFTLLPVLMGLLFFSLPVEWAASALCTVSLSIFGVAGMFGGVYLVCQPRPRLDFSQTSNSTRDDEAWPFPNQQELLQAARKCYVANDTRTLAH